MMHACVHACTEPLRNQAFALPTHALIGWTVACSPRRSNKQKSARFTCPKAGQGRRNGVRVNEKRVWNHACMRWRRRAGQGRAGQGQRGCLATDTSRDGGGGVELGKLTVVVTLRFCSQVRKLGRKQSTQWQAKIFLKRTQEKANFGILEFPEIRRENVLLATPVKWIRRVTTIVLRRYAMIQRDTRVVVATSRSKREDGDLMSAWGP
jgi:hypothetical protein